MSNPISDLREELLSGRITAEESVERAYQGLRDANDPALVITLIPPGRAPAGHEALPLWGVPFVVKDNIDVAGVPTTAGCPAFASTPAVSATVVERLQRAGAVPVAKVNLDQFATGLVGTRSPYGTPINPFAPDRIPGGSSSGSAVAVCRGIVPFALGTDTAGSGRVPAALTATVGFKPTRGWVSTFGVVPAVRTLDCVSVFALSVSDAWLVLQAGAGFDAADPYSRRPQPWLPRASEVRIGTGHRSLPVESLGPVVDVDLEPFIAAGNLLYEGPWVAERFAAVGEFIAEHPDEVDPVVGAIISGAARWSAADGASAGYRLAELRRQTDAVWDEVDVLVLPTVTSHPTLAEVAADPIGVNAALGALTTFVNLLDLCAVAAPVGIVDGLPTGVTVVAPAWRDDLAADVAARIHVATGGVQGVTGQGASEWQSPSSSHGDIDLVVVGAHLRGQPLHRQLTELDATFVAQTTTTPDYRLYALANVEPAKPGLVRVADGEGQMIEVEVYRLTPAAFGRFVAAVPAPLCIGTVRLSGGGTASGFLCEPAALGDATDITALGGWRAFRAR